MQSLQPEQGVFLLDAVFRPALDREHQATKKVIAAIPLDKGDYRPDPISKTALELAWHIATAENRFLEAVASGEFNFATSGKPDSIRNSADVAQWYEERFSENMDRLNRLSGDQLVKIIDFRGVMQLPAVMFLRIGMSHSIHHRGQLSAYLRSAGAKVPSIYGESYDDAEARKAAQAQTGTA